MCTYMIYIYVYISFSYTLHIRIFNICVCVRSLHIFTNARTCTLVHTYIHAWTEVSGAGRCMHTLLGAGRPNDSWRPPPTAQKPCPGCRKVRVVS